MKRLIFICLLLSAIASVGYAQNPVNDQYPAANIFTIDYQSGQQYAATSDDAILFKDAFINLVINTRSARMSNARGIPGHKTMVITQADPEKDGNAFQLSLQNTFLRQTTVIYTFLYNVDQNTLYFYNPSLRNWVPEVVQGNNVVNLNSCLAYGKFNDPNAQAIANAPAPDPQGGGDDGAEYDSPVDTAATVDNAPPALPEYEQPECPQEGYLWQPGYWAFSLASNNYYWVPGVWVAPPTVGYLWTPPYWGFYGGHYVFHRGYWGPTIGFYGGINYGFGYIGVGFVGGEWHEGHFRYNTAVVRVNTVVVHNTYVNTTVINRTVVRNRVSFNGQGGVIARPNEHEMAAAHENHIMNTREQIRNQQVARNDRNQFASANGGKPANLAAPRPPERGPNNLNQRPNGAQGLNQRPAGNQGFGQRQDANTNQRNNGTPGAAGTNPNGPRTMNSRPNNNNQKAMAPPANLPGAPAPNTPGTKGQRPNNRGKAPNQGRPQKDHNKKQ